MDLIIPLIFIGLAGFLIWFYVRNQEDDDIIDRIIDGYEDERIETNPGSFWRGASSISKMEKLDSFLEKSRIARKVTRNLQMLNTGMNFVEFFLLIAFIILLISALTYLRWHRLEFAVGSFLLIPIAAWMFLGFLAKRRIDKIEMQLPGLLTQMLTTIRSGGTPAASLRTAGENTAAPLGPSIRTLNESISLGIPPVKAWRNWSDTWYGSRACDMLSTSIRLKWEAGGEMASVLEVIQEQLESRRRRELRVRSLTAMARVSTYILIALPILMGLFTYSVNPRLYNEMIADPIGLKLLYIGAGLIVVGFFWLRKIATLDH